MDLTHIFPLTSRDPMVFAADVSEAGPYIGSITIERDLVYNGSAVCPECGVLLDPVSALFSYGLCLPCQARQNAALVKGKMTHE